MRFLKCANLNEIMVPKPTQEARSPFHPPEIDEIHVRQMQARIHFVAKPCFSRLGCSKSHKLHSGCCAVAKKYVLLPSVALHVFMVHCKTQLRIKVLERTLEKVITATKDFTSGAKFL